MRFSFTDDQDAFHDAVRDLLAHKCTAAEVRAAWANHSGRAPGAWNALMEMGVLDALRPEPDGGLGLNEVDVVRILEATGRAALPEPIVETMLVAAPMNLAPIGQTASATLPESPLAPWADSADVVISLAADGVRVHAATAIICTPRESVDGARRLFSCALNEAPIATADVATAFRRGVLGYAAQLCGLSDTMLALTVEYAKERKQFGAPIGSFQAVKHHLANARIKLEFARPLVYRAAASLAGNDPDASTHTSMAKAAASDAAMVAAKASLQCHGAIGYTTEHDLHLYMKRAWALSAAWGDAAWHRDRIGRALIGTAKYPT